LQKRSPIPRQLLPLQNALPRDVVSAHSERRSVICKGVDGKGRRYHRVKRMQISSRKREILRRVVEEHVATGQPVGSKAPVERADLRVSSSTVRGELAELESLGLLTHPHTSAGRLPTESGYRVYAEELVRSLQGRPASLGVDLGSMRDEIETALRATTDMLSRATRLLAIVS